MAHDVADGDHDPPVAELHRVVPVAADASVVGARNVPGRDVEPEPARQRSGKQAPLENFGGGPLSLEPHCVLERCTDAPPDLERERIIERVRVRVSVRDERDAPERFVPCEQRHQDHRAQVHPIDIILILRKALEELLQLVGGPPLRPALLDRLVHRKVAGHVIQRDGRVNDAFARRDRDHSCDGRVLLVQDDGAPVREIRDEGPRGRLRPLVNVEFSGDQLADASEEFDPGGGALRLGA